MTAYRFAPVLALLFGLFAQTAHANFGTPYITPAAPVAGDTISVNVYQEGHCDAILGIPGYPQISQQGNSITILFHGVRLTDPDWCIYGEGTSIHQVGTFPAGSYTLQVDLYYSDGVLPWQTETLGIVPFTIVGVPAAEAIAAPTLNGAGTGILLLIIVGVAARACRTHRSGVVIFVLACAPFAQSAHAYFGTPYITPAAPAAGDTISVNVYQEGHCDAILGTLGYPQISQQGNAITILFNGARETDPNWCIYGEGTGTYPFAAYPVGSYTLQVDLRYSNGAKYVVETLGVVPFTVAGVPAVEPVTTPTLDAAGTGILLLMIGVVAVWACRSTRSGMVIFVLVFAPFASAHAYFGTPYITPAAPVAGETISVNVFVDGPCDAILFGLPGYPQISQQGNAITILFNGVRITDPDWCIYDAEGTVTYPLGAYPVGSYTLQVDLYYTDGVLPWQTETLGVASFTVAAAPAAKPIAAPTLNFAGTGILFLMIIGVAVGASRWSKSGLIIIVLVCVPLAARAQDARSNRTIELLLTTAPGAPTPQQIVDYYARPVGPPPLRGLTDPPAESARYLLSERAEGDFLAWIEANPHSVLAELERYLRVVYPEGTDLSRALFALRADPYVLSASEPLAMEFDSVSLADFEVTDTGDGPTGGSQYGRDELNIDAAWQIAGGYALIAPIDTGLDIDHPLLRQFSAGGQYLGGNFIPIISKDLGGEGTLYPNGTSVDERESMIPITCAGNPPRLPDYASHGTHVSGLIAANGHASLGVKGTCKYCGVAMQKTTYPVCDLTLGVVATPNADAKPIALMEVGKFGAQVVNMSYGSRYPVYNYCQSHINETVCLALDHIRYRDIAMVASSGNGREKLNFPAHDTRVISAGGFQTNLALWDDWPNCPQQFGLLQCGSNWSTGIYVARQELMASAKSVLSTTYPGYNWSPLLSCGDGFPGPGFGNGVGWCTGTSMSAPQIAGVVGLLRSINPLAPVGGPPTAPAGTVRYVLASTTSAAQLGQPWNPQMGYGIPDAAAAAHKMLGKVANVFIRNRATPLFRLRNAINKDYADITAPQLVLGLMINPKAAWQPPSVAPIPPVVPGYTLPYDTNDPNDPNDYYDTPPPAPRASAYVLTTEFTPRNEWPTLIPLHLMDKDFAGTTQVDDFMLVTSVAEIQQAHNAGYNLRNIQGYIYQPCTPEPQCIPPGAEKFWRKYKGADTDCATFLESERVAFENQGYTAPCPAGPAMKLGYAYPATDSDPNPLVGQPAGDGLPDGFEYVVGTSPTRFDSDSDGVNDVIEFPMTGVPVSDPCWGGTGAKYCGADSIFRNGFDNP